MKRKARESSRRSARKLLSSYLFSDLILQNIFEEYSFSRPITSQSTVQSINIFAIRFIIISFIYRLFCKLFSPHYSLNLYSTLLIQTLYSLFIIYNHLFELFVLFFFCSPNLYNKSTIYKKTILFLNSYRSMENYVEV